jgi:ribosomal protein S18 acetylase RimI-like enzyme
MTVALRPMSAAEYDAWRVSAVADYAREFVDSAILSPTDAANRAEKDFARLLPDGLETEGHELFVALVDAEAVGTLWLAFVPGAGGMEGFVYEVSVVPGQRRRGYGRAIMEAAHQVCRARGAAAISLHVFGHNVAARALYDSLGYQVVSTAMKLVL